MWPFKKRPSPQPATSSASIEKAPVKEVVKHLMLLAGSQWHEEIEEGRSIIFQPSKQCFATTLNTGSGVLVTHKESSDLEQGELLKNSYELFIDSKLLGTYFECSYTSGGKMSGGDPCVAQLYTQVEREVIENRTNSREWRAAQQA